MVRTGAPRELFRGDYVDGAAVRAYHIAPDGRFLMLKTGDASTDQGITQVVLVQNWFQELTEQVPLP